MKQGNILSTVAGWLVKLLFIVITLFMGALIVLKSLNYYHPNFEYGYLSDKKNFFSGWFSVGLYVHIIVYPLLLSLATLLLFFQKVMAVYWHRTLGKVYVFAALVLGVPSAFILGVYSTSDTYSVPQFILLSLLFFVFTYLAYRAIKKRDYIVHEKMMIRSYIILLSAIFTRYYSFTAIRYFGLFDYDLIVLCSWLPHLMVYEAYILLKDKTTPSEHSEER